MVAKFRTGKTYGKSHDIVDGRDKDRLIAELREKIRLLENELNSKRDNVNGSVASKCLRFDGGLKNQLLHPEHSSSFTKTLLTLLPTPVFYKDTGGRYLGCNRAFSELMGVSPEQIEGKTVAELWPGDLAEMYMSMDRELLENCILQIYDYKVLDKDGKERPVIYVKDVYRDESNQIAGIVGTFIDVTERKLAEEALRVSEVRFNEVLDNLTDAFIIVDSKWRYIYVNKIAAKRFGMSKEELLGKVVWDLWPGSVGSIQYEQQLKTMEDKIPRTWIDHSATSNLWYEYRVFPWGDGIASFARDITERKRAEDTLIESEAKFRTLAEMSSAVIYVYQCEKLVYVNDAAEQITGYSKSELLEMKSWDIVHPDDKQKVIERGLARQREEAAPEQYEIRFVTKAGDVRWAELTGRRIIYMGKPAGMATFFDITDYKRTQEALLSSRQMLKDMIDNFPGVVFWKDRSSVYLGCNKNFSTAAGLADTESIIGKTDYDMPWAGTEAEAYIADDRQVMESGMPKLNIIETQTQASGRVAWFDTSKVPLFDAGGNVAGVLGVSGDITERMQAEQALQESEERLRLCIATAKLGTFDVDFVNDRHIWSPETYAIYGIEPGTPFTYKGLVDAILPEDRCDDLIAAELNPATSHGEFSVEYRIARRSDGEIRWIFLRARVLFEGEETERKAVRIIGAIQDITDRKRIEAALNEAKARAELYLDLMGHDISNMHQIALGYLELAQGLAPDMQQGEMIVKSVEVLQRSTQLIRNVRKLQKLDAYALPIMEIDLAGVLADVRREYGSVTNKTLTLNLNGNERCHVLANELLYDVFLNLVSNAVKHTGDGTSIAIDLVDMKEGGNRYYRVNVDDNGSGIPDDFKGIIFNRLLRGTPKAKGIGLGLYIVKKLVNNYGGRVWVEDRVKGDHKKGARFVVMLPAVDTASQ